MRLPVSGILAFKQALALSHVFVYAPVEPKLVFKLISSLTETLVRLPVRSSAILMRQGIKQWIDCQT